MPRTTQTETVIEAPQEKLERLIALRRRLADAEAQGAARFENDPVGFSRQVLGFWPWSKQREMMESVRDHARTAVRSCHGVGKGLALDTPIPTPQGWTTMGALEVGDVIFDEAGKPTRVTKAHPIRLLDCWRVIFDDGSSIVCDDEHLWTTLDFRTRHRIIERVRKTTGCPDWRDHWDAAETRPVGTVAATVQHNGQRSHIVPTAAALELPEADLPLDPYLLGVWLGDGDTDGARITCEDPEIVERLRRRGAKVTVHRKQPARAQTYGLLNGTTVALRRLGVLGDKHIPTAYLRASSHQRRELLTGLFDTDGWATGNVACLDVKCRALRDGAAELAVSLGWKVWCSERRAKLNGKDCGPVYRLRVRPDQQVFALPRKAARFRPAGQRSRHTGRVIVSVERTASVPTRCIAVDSPRRLYLAGEGMVPTHNTAGAAQVVLWFLATHRDSRVITTAPTWFQVEQLLWREIRGQVARAHGRGRAQMFPSPQTAKLELGEQWVALGLSTNEPDRFQGHHADHLLLVVDEASGVEETIFEAAEGFLTAEGAKVLLIGNPTSPQGQFHRCFTRERASWSTISISVFDSPNYTGEQVPEEVSRALPHSEWAAQRAAEWGEDSPIYRVRVLGEFPEGGEENVISLASVEAAQRRELIPAADAPRVVGCDVARFGSDETVIAWRHGWRVRIVEKYVGRDTTHTAGRCAHWMRELSADRIVVDDVGVGGGVTDQLKAGGFEVTPFNAAASAKRPGPDGYPNRRSEIWFEAAAIMPDLDLDPDEQLAADLTGPRYSYDLKLRRVVEKKEDTKKRLGRSPDRADAVLLTLVGPSSGTMGVVRGR